jgi:hypothetical protein
MMDAVVITAGMLRFTARMETEKAPATCAAFRHLLPLRSKLIQARWSGEAAWVPLGDMELELGPENTTSEPLPGQLLLYPRGVSETEILVPYGRTRFACREGALSGNHFLTIVEGMDQLSALGELVLWDGAQQIVFE